MILDFGSYIDEKARLFIGREWVFQDISDWLAQPSGSRYFLLTGEPGSGKTALAARLVQFSAGFAHPPARSEVLRHDFLSAIHFCRAGATSWLDARTFARSISLQLTSIPEFKQALIAVGDRDVNIDVQQQVDTAHSGVSITGVHIENLVISELSGQEAFNRTVLDPLRTIYNQGYRQPIVALVDSLDEALTHTADTSIVDLLANLQDVAPQVRLIVTSRQEPRVENKFRTADELFLSAPNYKSANDTDIHTYVSSRIEHDEQLARRMATLAVSQASVLADDITVKAEGNFQYVTFLLKALAEQQLSLDDVAGLPPGLDGLYFDSLDRVVKLGKKDWATTYKPLLGVLSVAQEPLTLGQMQAFSQLASDAWDALGDLLQFIETVPPSQQSEAELAPATATQENEECYRLYHQSVVDFFRRRQLMVRNDDKTKTQHNLYFLAADDWHKRIVAAYESKTGERIEIDWSQNNGIVGYGLRHLTSHLYQLRAVADYLAKLHVLLQSDIFIDRRLVVVPNPNLVLDDLRLTLDLALQNDDLPRVWAHILKYRRVLRNERDFEQIKQAVADHRYTLALERTALYSYLPNSQALARLWIAWAAATGHADRALAIAQHALERLLPRAIAEANTQADHPEVAYAVDEALQRLLVRIARTIAAGHEEQRDWLRLAVRAWPAQKQVIDRCAERLDAWGVILGAAQVDTPMPQLIEELKQRVPQPDPPFGSIREAGFFYRDRLAAGLFNTRNDGPVWLDYVRRTVTLLALDDYPSYREMALLWVSTAILAQENEELARSALAIVFGGVFKPEPGFWGDTIAAALDGLALESNQGSDVEGLLARLEDVEAKSERGVDPTVPRKLTPIIEWRTKVGLPTDPWSLRMRRQSAVAAVAYHRGDTVGAEKRLEQAGTADYEGSYAGFRTLARLSLACRWLEWRRSSNAMEQIEAAQVDACHMLDEVLQQERLDLVNKMRDWVTEVGKSSFVLAEQGALAQLQPKMGMERRLYVEFLSAVWHDDADRLKRLLPLALDDATTTDAVLGRLLGIEATHVSPDRPFLALVRTMDLAADLEG